MFKAFVIYDPSGSSKSEDIQGEGGFMEKKCLGTAN